ncbi:VOC family protein [Nonomuraea rhizosphaerae]|uniref:VOC family protein n=1 Tax=Nonomuraea rhizosphaerae TaxID=2665663 RepID=UPI001C5EEC5C|nr:VOC family protein [Nonomuraea rhizosphaerae]
MNVLGVDNILVDVGDLARAREFYGGVLGLREKFSTRELALFAIGEETPGLLVRAREETPGPLAREGRPGSMRVWLEVPDARAAAQEVGGEAFEVLTGWTVEIADPWGNVVGLTDYAKRPRLSRTGTGGT